MAASYPKVISKQDPLIVRVDALILLVDSTTYSAKIKFGIALKAFNIYSSGLGSPIYQQDVDVSGMSEEGVEDSDAYKAIVTEATLWIDKLEDSFSSATSGKSLVDVVNELKAQSHFDITGSEELHTDEMVFDNTASNLITTINNLSLKLDKLDKLDSITDALTSIKNKLCDSSTTLGDQIASAVETALDGIMGEFADLSTAISGVQTTASGIQTVASGTDDLVNNIVETLGTKPLGADTVYTLCSSTSEISGDISTLSSTINDIKFTVNTINNTSDTINNRIYDTQIKTSSLHGALTDLTNDTRAMHFDPYRGWFIKTDVACDSDLNLLGTIPDTSIKYIKAATPINGTQW